MIRPTLIVFASVSLFFASASVAVTAPASAAEQILRPPEPGRFKALFQPLRTDITAISPDGKYLAYALREGERLSVIVLDIDRPETIKAQVQVVDSDGASPMLAADQSEKTPGRINWMRWVTSNRVVVETNKITARSGGMRGAWRNWRGEIIAFDADGSNAKVLVNPKALSEFADDESISPGANQPQRGSGQMPVPDSEAALLPFGAGRALPSTSYGMSQLCSLRVFDLDPQRPEFVTVLSTAPAQKMGSYSLSLYSLNTKSGKLTRLAEKTVAQTDAILLDRQGRVRITLPNSRLAKFPFHYQYRDPKGSNRPVPLDSATGLAGFSVSPENYFGERAIPLGFDEDPDLLYYAANTGRDTFGIYSVNLATRQRGSFAMETPDFDLTGLPESGFPDQSTFVFDRYQRQLIGVRYLNALGTTVWARPDLHTLQASLEKAFPNQSVEISDWDEAGRRYVVSLKSPSDPGAFFIYDRDKNKFVEFVRRAPWIDASKIHVTQAFSSVTADGAQVSGLVTLPNQPRLKPMPMILLCPDFPWQRVRVDFQTEVQALADMGFAVAQLNGRGAWGFGLKQRQSLTRGYDLTQVEDIAAAIAILEKNFSINPHRVALMGRGHGGFIALRAIQTYPEKFRCTIALDAPVDLSDWLAEQRWSGDNVQPHLTRAWLGDAARLKAAPLTSHSKALTKPLLMLNYPGPKGSTASDAYRTAHRFAGEVREQGTTVEFDKLPSDYMNGLSVARADVFDRIEEFLNLHIYDFNVKLRELQIGPDRNR